MVSQLSDPITNCAVFGSNITFPGNLVMFKSTCLFKSNTLIQTIDFNFSR